MWPFMMRLQKSHLGTASHANLAKRVGGLVAGRVAGIRSHEKATWISVLPKSSPLNRIGAPETLAKA